MLFMKHFRTPPPTSQQARTKHILKGEKQDGEDSDDEEDDKQENN